MLHHVVIWTFKPEVTDGEKEQFLAEMRRMLGAIPHVRSFAVGANVTPARAQGFTHMLVSTYDDLDGLRAYAEDPRHVPMRERQRQLSSNVLALDIDV